MDKARRTLSAAIYATKPELTDVYYSFQPHTEQEKLWLSQCFKIIRDFKSARLERIYSSWGSLGKISWAALGIGGIFAMFLPFFFAISNFKVQVVVNTLFANVIIMMLFLVYLFDNPFKNPQTIQPKAYEAVYNYYKKAREKNISPEEQR